MGKKITNVLLFLAVLAAAVGMTVYVGQGASGVMLYNFIFLGVMVVIYGAGMFGGMFKMNHIAAAFGRAAQELTDIFKLPGKADPGSLSALGGIFQHKYLDQKMDHFIAGIEKSQEGIGDIEDYINEEELDIHIHKRLLEMVPDIFTSLGILGTFVGLVWGLKNFQPNDYETMTTSVASLVDGIKVAFLTSIYGISFSIIYTCGMKNEYSGMTERLQAFMEKFHAYVLPTAENESRNLLVASQKLQTQAIDKMAEQFSVQLAGSFEKVITPTFQRMNDSLDLMVTSVTRCQQDAVKDILDVFMREMRSSFKLQFDDFNAALEQMKRAQKENADYTASLYQTMSRQLSESYVKQDRTMKEAMTRMESLQGRYADTVNRVMQDSQNIQKLQQQDYKHVVSYMREAEQSAAKFWVACNQAMQKYVEAAAAGMERAGAANKSGAELLEANRNVVRLFDKNIQELAQYQKLTLNTMEQVRLLLSDITVARENDDIYLLGGRLTSEAARNANRETLEKLRQLLEEQGSRQETLLEEMAKSVRDLSKAASKGKLGLFR